MILVVKCGVIDGGEARVHACWQEKVARDGNYCWSQKAPAKTATQQARASLLGRFDKQLLSLPCA